MLFPARRRRVARRFRIRRFRIRRAIARRVVQRRHVHLGARGAGVGGQPLPPLLRQLRLRPLDPDQQVTEAELIAWCKDKAAGYKAPTSIEFRDELARTATGKLQKFKLREPYWAGQIRQVN